MKIMITGGSGYFGTALNLYLSNKGHEVWSFDAGFFKDNWLGPPVKLNEKWIDARDITETHIQLYDAIIHFAGISNDPLKQLSEDELHRPSLIYTKNLANICKKLGKKFIFASSCSVYGYSKEIVDETSQPNPLTPYSATKLQIEKILNELKDETWQPIILRFATIFGFSPRMRFDTVINMFCGMFVAENRIGLNSDGRAIRPFIEIDSACSAVEYFLKTPPKDFGDLDCIYNIGENNKNISILELLKVLITLNRNLEVKRLKDFDSQSVFFDRKIQSGKDIRSYMVNFNKFNSLNTPHSTLNFELQLGNLIEQLKRLNLKSVELKDPRYYRLQSLEQLIESNKVNAQLLWTNV